MTRRELRNKLRMVCPTDEDLEAFCLDYFPDIKQQFSAGMNRTQKDNLILEIANPAQLEQSLKEKESAPPYRSAPPRSSQPGGQEVGRARIAELFTQLHSSVDSVQAILNFDVAYAFAKNGGNVGKTMKVYISDIATAKEGFAQCKKKLAECSFFLKPEDSEAVKSFIDGMSPALDRLELMLKLGSEQGMPGALLMADGVKQTRLDIQKLLEHKQDIERRLRQYAG